jgi:hypothetical protein
MNAYVSYAEIPRAERKRLGREAYREEPVLRLILFAAILGGLMFSGLVLDQIKSRYGPISVPTDFAIRIPAAVIFCAVIWEPFGRGRFKAAVEKLKNSP